MTPEERNLITSLFERLATLESSPRDAEAERAIKDGLQKAPNAVYALVQTALVQDEALKRADARIQELEDALGLNNAPTQPAKPAGFLDSMRGAIFGRQEPPPPQPRAGSVPSVRAGESPWGNQGGYNQGMPPGAGQPGPGQMPPGTGPGMGPGMEPPRQGGSFLGTAAAAAAGVIGGSLALDAIRSMMGHGHNQGGIGGGAGGGTTQAAASPWSGSSGGGSGDLARDAGVDNIGRAPTGDGGGGRGGYGMLNSNNTNEDVASNNLQDDLQDDDVQGDDLQEADDTDYDDSYGDGGSSDE